MSPFMSLHSQNNYEIKIYGQLNFLTGLFGKAKAHAEVWIDDNQVTTFSNVVMDQVGLVRLIRRLHGREIVWISIRQVEILKCLSEYQIKE